MIKAVVIDANAISRNLLSSVLINGSFDVIGGANLSSAGLASMIKLGPQIVCVDIGHTDAEGWEKLDTIRHGLPKALVFLVSGKFDATTVQCAAERGVHGFIVKPFNAGTVLATVRRAIIKVARQHRASSSADQSA
jgi:two-component system chemotaxis response regulator CheY